MKIGLFFGSFNPIHNGHLILANHMAEYTDLDQVWLVVTPHNPHKQKESLLDDYERMHMVNLATEDYEKLRPSDIEFKLPQPNYTVNTLAHLTEKFPQHEFSLIMGEDNLRSLHKWKNYGVIVAEFSIYVYPRKGTTEALPQYPNVRMVDAPIVEISSTFIRKAIAERKNTRPLLPEKVWAHIDQTGLYET